MAARDDDRGGVPAAERTAVVGSGLTLLDTRGADVGAGFGAPGQIGELLLTKFLLPFEAASFLLLVAAVGAVVLARKRRGLEEPADAISVADLVRSDVGTQKEAIG